MFGSNIELSSSSIQQATLRYKVTIVGFYIEIGNRDEKCIAMSREDVEAILSKSRWTRRIDAEIEPDCSEAFYIFSFGSKGDNIGGRIDIIERESEGFRPPWLNIRLGFAERPQPLLQFMPELFQLAGELKMQVWYGEQLVTPDNASSVLFEFSKSNTFLKNLLG